MFSSPDSISYFSKRNIAIWMSLAFQAGVINAGGFLACHRFVTHTTGFGTTFGVEVASHHWLEGLGMLATPLFFISGAMISATLVDRRMLKGEAPLYGVVLLLMVLLMALVTFAGLSGQFGIFGESFDHSRDYALLALLSLTSGLQNAMITSAFGAVIRTTHLTGITTDLGIGLVRLFSRSSLTEADPSGIRWEARANMMRIGIIFGFIAGSTLSSFIFISAQFWGFLIPALISAILWLVSRVIYHRRVQQPLYSRLAG